MDRFTVARQLDEIARYVQLEDATPFRARAFEKAARAVEDLEEDLAHLIATGRLYGVHGIGRGTGEVIEEIMAAGTSSYLEALRAKYPPRIFDLLRVPKLGLRKLAVLHAELGVGSLDELEAAARSGALSRVRGFGPKAAQQVLEGVRLARTRESRFLLPAGLEIAESLRRRIEDLDEAAEVAVSGSVRRRMEVIRNVNLVVATDHREALTARLAEHIADLEPVDASTLRGRARGEIDVFVHLTARREFGSVLLRTTGSAAFVSALEEIGRLPRVAREPEVFRKLGVPFVEPERRETADDLARKRRPRLVDVGHLRGAFHVHTTWSDGRNSVADMLAGARRHGWAYVGLSDHSKAAHYAGGLTEDQIRLQHAEIAREEKAVAPMRVFRGTEADILRDGTIDYGPRTLGRFDFVVASVHSTFQMDRDAMTERILRALDDPHVTFLGHLTGRLLLSREGYTVDYDRIFERAAERGVMIEINGNPRRLDVDWRHLRRAADRGVTFGIHPDAHSVSELDAVVTGTWVARKGGLAPAQIFNTRSLDEVEEFLRRRREGASPAGS